MTIATPFTSNKRIPIRKIRLSHIFTDYYKVDSTTYRPLNNFWLVEVKAKGDWTYKYYWKYDCESLARTAADELYANGYVEVPVFEVEISDKPRKNESQTPSVQSDKPMPPPRRLIKEHSKPSK